MVISGLYINTLPGQAVDTAKRIEKIKGVDVYHIEEGCKIIITIEAETIDKSYKIAETIEKDEDVLTVCLAYSNFEEEPLYQQVSDQN